MAPSCISGDIHMIRWTNKSVIRFAGDSDPVVKIQEEARGLTLQAMENGWTGPPYNPLQIANLLNVIVEPTFDIADARTLLSEGRRIIEFNPSRPRERARFSIAHEIAHLLFDDVFDEPRHRGGSGTSGDEWQLEMLCNLAASEFLMPIGSLAANVESGSIEQLMTDRRRYDVSAEAYMIRVAKVHTKPMGVFCASIREQRYRVDYFVPSSVAPSLRIVGTKIPRTSAAYHCTAIGYTDRGEESWISGTPLPVEYVGVPAYPNAPSPRVIGLVRFQTAEKGRTPIRHVHGNVLEPRGTGVKVVCQLVNNVAKRWGGGIARQAAQRFPSAETEFGSWITGLSRQERLGQVHFSTPIEDVVIASIVGQEGYGRSIVPRVQYRAIESGLARVARFAYRNSATVHLPRIGTGSASGNWEAIMGLIQDEFVQSGLEVTVYTLPPRSTQSTLL